MRYGHRPVRNVVLEVCFTARLQRANIHERLQGRDVMDHAIGTAYCHD
jgi:hypothetical protein